MECKLDNGFFGYRCLITNQDFSDFPYVEVIADHIGNYTDGDIVEFFGQNLTINHFPRQVLEKFYNLERFTLEHSQGFYDLSGNDFTRMPALNYLSVKGNSIEKVDYDTFYRCEKLEVLDLSDNKISEFQAGIFKALYNLKSLYARRNVISRLESYLFAGTYQLEKLDLAENVIETIGSDVFDYLKELRDLLLRGNVCINEDFTNLSPGDVYDIIPKLSNCFEVIPDKELECEFGNAIVNGVEGYTCTLTKIEVYDLIATIQIVGEHQQGMTSSDVINVRIIDSYTRIFIPQVFDFFSNLRNMEVTRSGLEYISYNSFINARNLQTLSMNHNQLYGLEMNTFLGASSLTHLEIEHNYLEKMDPRAFGGLENIQRISLAWNKMQVVYGEFFETNLLLGEIILDSNGIYAIQSNFISNNKYLDTLVLSNNACTDESFFDITKDGKEYIDKALRTCFQNFDNNNRPGKRYILEVRGEADILTNDGDIIVQL